MSLVFCLTRHILHLWFCSCRDTYTCNVDLHTPSTEILDVFAKRQIFMLALVLCECADWTSIDTTVDHVFKQKFCSRFVFAQLPCTKMDDSNTYNGSAKHLCNRQGIMNEQKRDRERECSCGGTFVVVYMYMCTTMYILQCFTLVDFYLLIMCKHLLQISAWIWSI